MKEAILILILAWAFALFVISIIRYGLLRETFEIRDLIFDIAGTATLSGICFLGALLIVWIVL